MEEEYAKLDKLKFRLMELTGINPDYIDFYNIYVNEEDSVHVLIIDDYSVEEKPDFVFIHGLTGTSLQFFKLFKPLSLKMRIIAIDLPGMGLSNRADVNANNYDYEKAEDYFLSRLDIAFDKLGVKDFHFLSHSFGGYISCLYTMNNPSRVKSLILLSPVGISSHFIEYASTNVEDMFQRIMYNLKKPPTFGYQMIGMFAKSFFEKILSNKLKKLDTQEENDVFASLMQGVFKLKATSENLIYKFFNGNIQAYKPVCFYYESFEKIKIDFIYGDSDWNPIEHAEELKKLLPNNVDIEVLDESGHLLNCDNPKGLTETVLRILKKNKIIPEDVKNNIVMSGNTLLDAEEKNLDDIKLCNTDDEKSIIAK